MERETLWIVALTLALFLIAALIDHKLNWL